MPLTSYHLRRLVKHWCAENGIVDQLYPVPMPRFATPGFLGSLFRRIGFNNQDVSPQVLGDASNRLLEIYTHPIHHPH